ncbi:hypothetical protein DYU11_04025 [Fibrisoma montanum]|uniref:Tandem-95 repeat protein n=1 Tax=Fibrisoma montanum TaxID=2305895 RepID=A0A418MJH1_9BACT|nr:Ig-like domain-containing protein [Fibrisoma montanum]RIV27481.1 hypothetical protein DYU11_04025 [Fibrisoma montanum]
MLYLYKNTRLLTSILLTASILACDRIGQEVSPGDEPNTGVEFYTMPTQQVAIDLKSYVDLTSATTFKISKAPQQGEASFSKEGVLIYTPNVDFVDGSDQFLISSDKAGAPVRPFTINVTTDTSRIPCYAGTIADVVRTAANTAVTIEVLKNDRFCTATVNTSSLGVLRAPKNGTVAIEGDKVVYKPNENFNGYDDFFYKITVTLKDGQVRTLLAPVKVVVGDPFKDCQLKLNDDQISFRQRLLSDSLIMFPLLNDQLCKASRQVPLTITQKPANGTAYLLTPTRWSEFGQLIVYKPNPGYNGDDELTYQRCENGECLQAVVRIKVKSADPNCKLTAVNDERTISLSRPALDVKRGVVLLSVLLNDRICAGIKDVRINNNPGSVKLDVLRDGSILYTLDQNPKPGETKFSYEVTDVLNNKSSAEVKVVIKE